MHEEHWLGAELPTSSDKSRDSLKSETSQSRTPHLAVWNLTASLCLLHLVFSALILHCFGSDHSGRDDKGFKGSTLQGAMCGAFKVTWLGSSGTPSLPHL